MIITAEGIVLRQRKIANGKRMVVLLTKQYGKLSAGTSISEKSRGKAALALRPFSYAEYDIFKGRSTYGINSAQTINSFYSIGEELERFTCASAFLTYTDKVLEEEAPAPGYFDLSLDFLRSVSVSRPSCCETILYAFIVKSLKLLGVAPELGCCVNCGKAPDAFGDSFRKFSVSGGGIICPECAEEEKRASASLIYSPDFDITNVFRYFDSKPIKTFEKVDLRPGIRNEVREILAGYTDRWLGVDVLRRSEGLEV